MRAIPRFLAPSILKSSQRGKFAPEPYNLIISPTIHSRKYFFSEGRSISNEDISERLAYCWLHFTAWFTIL